ncbi:sensitivity to high expression protein she9 [Ascosphaera pollenicola]|nr:sensitivity to high expression protein she9 [Ascosphaera pollenicola]
MPVLPHRSPLFLLRTSLLRSGPTAAAVTLRTTQGLCTRNTCTGYIGGNGRGLAALRHGGGGGGQKKFYSVRSDASGNGNDGGSGEKKQENEEDNVIFYQPPPEGYKEPSQTVDPSDMTPQDAQSKSEPQLGYIFDNARPQNDGQTADSTAQTTQDAETIGIGSTHGTKNSEDNGAFRANERTVDVNGDAGASTTSAMDIAQANMGADVKGSGGSAAPGTTAASSTNFVNSLPSQIQQRRSEWRKKFETMMDNMQSNVFMAGQTLNDLTGYSAIERLKQEILEQEEAVRAARRRVRECKEAYTDAIHRRSASQREVNELLQRKHAWSPTDVERFTSLYRSDHANERGEAMAQEELANAERESEEASTTLSRSILARYHEEQIWSDKIRRMSTWGTWGLMGVNVLLFLIFQIAVEPWRRKRLVTGFEEKVLEALEKEREITVQRESDKDKKDAGPVMAAATAAIEAVREAAREMRGAVHDVGEQFDANEVTGDAMVFDDGAEAVPIAEQTTSVKEEAAEDVTITPESSAVAPPALELDEEALQAQFRRFIAKILVKLPPSVAQKAIDQFRNDTTVSLTPRDVSAIALEGAAAGAALTSIAAGILVMVFRGQ